MLRIRRGGSGSYLLDYKKGFGLLLDKPNQLIRVHIKGRGNAPDGFEICLLAAAFYHCKMASRKLCKPAENLLRKPFAFSYSSHHSADGVIVEFCHRRHLPRSNL